MNSLIRWQGEYADGQPLVYVGAVRFYTIETKASGQFAVTGTASPVEHGTESSEVAKQASDVNLKAFLRQSGLEVKYG